MSQMTLFLFPGGCSRVALTALEHVGAEYKAVMVNLMKGEHMRPEYQAHQSAWENAGAAC